MPGLVRLGLILAATVTFLILGLVTVARSGGAESGRRRLSRALAAVSLVVALGGIQRLLLQAVYLGMLPGSVREFVLGDPAGFQAIIVLCVGIFAWRALASAERAMATADQLLSAFGRVIPSVDWSQVPLTKREREVLNELASGRLKDGAIADELSISHETVRSHIKSIMRKSGINSRVELAVAVHQHAVGR